MGGLPSNEGRLFDMLSSAARGISRLVHLRSETRRICLKGLQGADEEAAGVLADRFGIYARAASPSEPEGAEDDKTAMQGLWMSGLGTSTLIPNQSFARRL